jgi:DNA modification methylase
MQNTKIQIEHVEVAKLIPYARNSRTHSPAQVKQIAASIREFGFMNPVLIDATNTIIAGHGRVMAAEHLQLQSVPCVRHEHLTEAQRRAYVIADNKLAMNADWDEEMLKVELHDLHMAGFDVGILGFDSDELSDAMSLDDQEVVEDEIPAPQMEAITNPGDLWLLGEHRLLCGDSTVNSDVKKLIGNQVADLLLTDPPYNVNYEGSNGKKIANDSMPDQRFREFLKASFELAFDSCRAGAAFYIWHADSEGFNFRAAVKDCNQQVRQCLIWVKNSLVLGRQDYQWQHEPCLYGWKAGASHSWYSGRADTTVFDDSKPTDITKLKKEELINYCQSLIRQIGNNETTVLREAKPNASIDHPTMKPVILIARLIKNSSAKNELIYDPFLGSGTTLIAAEQLGRKCYGMELSPQYCDVIVKRWETLTGKKAERVSNGQT